MRSLQTLSSMKSSKIQEDVDEALPMGMICTTQHKQGILLKDEK